MRGSEEVLGTSMGEDDEEAIKQKDLGGEKKSILLIFSDEADGVAWVRVEDAFVFCN